MSFCGDCGERVAATDRFCGSCGALTEYATITDPTPIDSPRPAGVATAGPTDDTVPTVLAPLSASSVFGLDPTPVPPLASPAAAPTAPVPTAPVPPPGVPPTGTLGGASPFDPAPSRGAPAPGASIADDASGEWLRPARRSWSPALVVGFIALVALAAGATVLLLDRGDDTGTAPSATTVATTLAGSATSAPTTLAATTTTVAATSTTVVLSPEQQLAALKDADHEAVEEFVGRWVPQLSAKKAGTVDDGITYDNAAVLEFHEGLRTQFGALLLFSGDYTYQTTDLWVSIAPESFATAAGALQWCVDEGVGRDDCFAKLITHDPSITDTVQMQP